jgi:LysR family transcriptional regulator for metE and metH
MIERMHLRIIREVSKCGSLTAAADSLHLTQSALSHSIKKLENQIGTAIWQKEGRKIQFTQAGTYLLEQAERVLPQIESVDETLKSFAAGTLGTLKIGMECHPCYRWMLALVKQFLADCPGVDVDVKLAFQFGGMNALTNHEIDILVTPDPFKSPDTSFVPVFDYEQVAVLPPRHPLCKQAYIKPEDFLGETLYTYPVAPDRLDIFTMFLGPADCQPKTHKTADATEIMLQLVEAGRGIATLPGWLVEEYREQFHVVPLRLGSKGVHKKIHLGRRNHDSDNVLASEFITLAKKNETASANIGI